MDLQADFFIKNYIFLNELLNMQISDIHTKSMPVTLLPIDSKYNNVIIMKFKYWQYYSAVFFLKTVNFLEKKIKTITITKCTILTLKDHCFT